MLLDLNIECLHMICDYLEVKDQVILSLVCKELENFIDDRLRRTCKKISFFSEFWRTKENEIYLPKLLKNTTGTVENMEIMGNLIMSNRNWLQELKFEKVTVLYISLRKLSYDVEEVLPLVAKIFPNVEKIRMSGQMLDKAIGMVAELYPNIRKMKLYDQCTGCNVVKMQNLQALFIHTGCDRFDGHLLSQLARAPKLRALTYLRNYGYPQRIDNVRYVENLEELTIHNLDFEDLKRANIFKQMKSLRKITTYEYPLFYTLNLEDKYFYRQLDGFSITRRYSTDVKVIVDAPRLRRIWCNREFDILPDFCNEAAKPFNRLEEFYYIYCRAVDETQRNVMTVVTRSPKLRLLDISGTKFDVGFIESLLGILKWKKRTSDLQLRCYNTKISKEEVRCLNLPRYLKVSFEKFRYDLPTRNTINFQIYLSDQAPAFED